MASLTASIPQTSGIEMPMGLDTSKTIPDPASMTTTAATDPAPIDASSSNAAAKDSDGDGDGEHVYSFHITMSCGGCSGAVDRVLKKMDGLKSYSVSLESQSAEVRVDGRSAAAAPPPDFATVLEKIKKTGKTVTKAECDGKEMEV